MFGNLPKRKVVKRHWVSLTWVIEIMKYIIFIYIYIYIFVYIYIHMFVGILCFMGIQVGELLSFNQSYPLENRPLLLCGHQDW